MLGAGKWLEIWYGTTASLRLYYKEISKRREEGVGLDVATTDKWEILHRQERKVSYTMQELAYELYIAEL